MARPKRPQENLLHETPVTQNRTEVLSVFHEEDSEDGSAIEAAIEEDSRQEEDTEVLDDASIPSDAAFQRDTSPAEEKIRELVKESTEEKSLNGWHLIDDEIHSLPPRNGMPVRLSENTESEGVIAFWKKTRAFANATKRYEPYGKWVDFVTGQNISFVPKYWKERHV